MTEQLGIGYIGFGDHCSQSHEPFLEPSELTRTIGVADLADIDVSGVNFADDPIITKDYHELLGDERVNAVVITTGDVWHYRMAKDALAAGKHVLVEKPAAAAANELAALPALFDEADAADRRLWVCHPREFGDGPWRTAARLAGNPALASEVFGVGPLGRLQELRYDCHYTVPNKQGLHTSFADDKMNHTIVSALRTLPGATGFRDAVLLDNGPTRFDSRLITISDDPQQDGIVIRAAGRRSAHSANHGGGVWRDWIEVVFEEGTMRVEPTLGRIALTYGRQEQEPLTFDTAMLYDGMFGSFNDEFVRCSLDSERPEPLTRQARIMGTAAAILMQQPGFNGLITEETIRQPR